MTEAVSVKRLTHFINGELVEGKSSYSKVYNPSTGEVIAEVPIATAEETREAIAAAKAAFPSWRDLSVAIRA